METKEIIRRIPKGEFIRLVPGGPVWIRGDYDRASKTFELQSTNDANRVTYRKGDSFAYFGFTY